MTWFRHQMAPDLVLDPQVNPDFEQAEKLLTNSGV
jgi:tRNA dimethylallyltransferase